jgi:serine/threonine protein kinase/Tfp pilus assembly protein PilF
MTNDSFDEVLAKYLNEVDLNPHFSLEHFLRRHEEHREDLEGYLASQHCLQSAIRRTRIQSTDKRPTRHVFDALELKTLGDYQLLEGLNFGGMGDVYRARQISLDRIVALKVINADTLAADRVTRFENESKLAAQLAHPHIVQVFECGRDAQRYFFSMELIDGFDLDQIASNHGMQPEDAAHIMAKLARAVQYAHDQGVLHRDIKPSNVILESATHEPRLTDFGLATSLLTAGDLTVANDIVGTPQYMAPEQLSGNRNSNLIDVYSLGATLYFLLVGAPPFKGRDAVQTMHLMAHGRLQKPRELDRTIPIDLETICLKCLDRDPKSRYASAGTLAEELSRYLEGKSILARPAGRTKQVVRWSRRTPLMATLGFTTLAALLASPFVAFTIATNNRRLAKTITQLHETTTQLQEQTDRAEQVTDYMVDAFRTPDKSRDGKTITIYETLVRQLKELETQFGDKPRLKAQLTLALARSFQGLGQLEEAIAASERSVALYESSFGDKAPETLDARNQLAISLFDASKISECLLLQESILADRRQVLGESHPDTQSSVNNLAVAYRAVGRFEESIEMLTTTVQTRTHILGRQHADTRTTMRNLALSYTAAGQLDMAEKWAQESLAASDGSKAANDLDAWCNEALVNIFHETGRHTQALDLAREIAQDMAAIHGTEHPQYFSAQLRLASLLAPMDHDAEATKLLKRVVPEIQKSLGKTHPIAIEGMAKLAMQTVDTDGTALLAETISLAKARFGETHPHVFGLTGNLGLILLSRGEHAQAVDLYERLLQQQTAALGAEHASCRMTRANLGYAYLENRQLGKAEHCLQQVLAGYPNDKHPDVASTTQNLGLVFLQTDRAEEALPLFQKALTLTQAQKGPASQATVTLLLDITECLTLLKRREEATDLLDSSMQTIEKENPQSPLLEQLRTHKAELSKMESHSP